MTFWKRNRKDAELDEELRAHLALAAQERIKRGEPPGEAFCNARRELGNELLIKEVTREMWGTARWENLIRDLRYILRQSLRSPAFSLTAVLTLALGIAATVTMFTVVNGVLLKPLNFPDPDRLYLARSVPPKNFGLVGDFPVNARHYQEWRSRCQSCSAVALVRFDELTLIGAGEPVRLPTYSVSYNFFRTMGIQPALGRDFLAEEESSLGSVILSDSLWRNRFAADPSVIGRTVTINGESHLVVGVLPPGIHLPKGNDWGTLFGPNEAPQIFRTVGLTYSRLRPIGNLNYSCVIRLKPQASPQQTATEMNALLADFRQKSQFQLDIILTPLHGQMTRRASSALWLLLGTVAAVLLIVCVNIGNLMLVRTTGRFREAGIRLALGAGRADLFGLVVKEAVVLVGIGTCFGLAIAHQAIRIFVAQAPVSLPRLEEIRMDWQVLIFAAGASAFSAAICCLFPAWRLSRIDPNEALKAGSSTSTEPRRKVTIREAFVGLEVAVSTVLLIVGGLLLASFVRLIQNDRGFEVDHVVTQDVSFLSPKYAHGVRRQVVAGLAAKMALIPTVTAVGAVNQLPLIGEDWISDLEDPDQPPLPPGQAALANMRFVTPDYFKAMAIPLKQGRLLNDADKDKRVAVISERVGRILWPNQSPIGKHVRGGGSPPPSLEVVGVVAEVNAGGLETPTMMVYEHYWRMQPISISFALRTRGSPEPVITALHSILSNADPEMAIQAPKTMEQILDESIAPRRFEMGLAVFFAVAALLLASIGIYGLISFSVARRSGEIAIRIALGAQRGQLLRMVFRDGLRPVVFGLSAGLIGGLALSRLLAAQLYGIAPHDPFILIAVIVVFLAVAVWACSVPAIRALRVDPIAALRFE